MKVIKTMTQEVIEEVPFDWKELQKDLDGYNWFNPEDPDEWDDLVGYLEDKYTYEEFDQHRDEIIQFMKDRRKNELPRELDWYLSRAMDDITESDYKITEKEIHNWITNYFKK